MRARTSSWLIPSSVATRPVVAPVSRASATTSRSSCCIGANALAGRRAQREQHRALGERRSRRRAGAATITRSVT